MNHTYNLLPRIQAEGIGPATFLGRRLAKVFALGLLAAILGQMFNAGRAQPRWLGANGATSLKTCLVIFPKG
jgi:hypothetical protein